ncbi:hypothetical protein V5O48_002180 [Marasmius crinis-equi]|uniref:Ubiquitin-like protease family profile domain-containing protein n=1 Tax=Marasmius crinis-equi TaxID=585013 RepID=A0ABR3FWP7_9AGAR
MEGVFAPDRIQAQPPPGALIQHEPSKTIRNIGMYPWRTALLFHEWNEIKNEYLDHQFSLTAQSILSEISNYVGKRLKGKTFDFTEAIVNSKGTGRGLIIRLAFALIFLDRAPIILGGIRKAIPVPDPIPRTRIIGRKSLNVRALKLLDNWPKFFREAEIALEAYDKAGTDKRNLDSMNFNAGSVADVQMNMFSKCLKHVQNIKSRITHLKIHTITLNIELCALFLHWFSLGHADLPHSSSEFKSQLKKNRILEGQILPTGNEAYDVTKLRTALHTALALSPLIVLSPEINLFTQDAQSLNMLQLWFHFGNQQPHMLKALDAILWDEMNSVDGCNKTALDALRSILQRAKPLLYDIDTESQQWFSRTYGEVDYRQETPIWSWISQLPENERDGSIEPEEEQLDIDCENEDLKDKNSPSIPDAYDATSKDSTEVTENSLQNVPTTDEIELSTTNPEHSSTFPQSTSNISRDLSSTKADENLSVSARFFEITGFDPNVEDAESWLVTTKLPERIVINHISLTTKDLCRLQQKNWINDEIINAFFSCFEFPSNCWILSSLLWTMSLQKLSSCQTESMVPKEIERHKARFMSCSRIMIPIHDIMLNHWIAVAIDRDANKITVYDSLAGVHAANNAQLRVNKMLSFLHKKLTNIDDRLQHVKEWLKKMYQECSLTLPVWSENIQPSTQGLQTNAYDCGIFALANIVLHGLTGGVDNNLLTQRVVPSIRAGILHRLLATNASSSSENGLPTSIPIRPNQKTTDHIERNISRNVDVDLVNAIEHADEDVIDNGSFIETDTEFAGLLAATESPVSGTTRGVDKDKQLVQLDQTATPNILDSMTRVPTTRGQSPESLDMNVDSGNRSSSSVGNISQPKPVLEENSDEIVHATTSTVMNTNEGANGFQTQDTLIGLHGSKTARLTTHDTLSRSPSPVDSEDQPSIEFKAKDESATYCRRSSREKKPVERSEGAKDGSTRRVVRHVNRKTGKGAKATPVSAKRTVPGTPKVSKHYVASQIALDQPSLVPDLEHHDTESTEQLERLLYASGEIKIAPDSTAKYPAHDSSLSRPEPPPKEVHPNPFPVKRVIPLTFDEYQDCDEHALQQMFRYCPVVVSNVPRMNKNSRWDAPTLKKLGCIHAMRQAHDKSIIPVKEVNEIIVKTSLNDALAHGMKVNMGKPLNFLDIPGYGDFYCDTLLASELYAYKQTLAHPRLFQPIPEDNIWHLVATKDVFTPLHMDAEGAAVMILVEVGAKLVFMLVPSSRDMSEAANVHYSLDMDPDMDRTWSSAVTNGQIGNVVGWEVQGVLLRPGDMLWTCWALFHSFVMGRSVTNTDHTKNRTSLVRLMVFWHKEFVEREWQPGSLQNDDLPHMPDWMSMTGFVDFLTLSNIFELGPALWRETYDGEEPDEEQIAEFDLARTLSRQIFQRYTKLFNVRVIDVATGHHIRAMHVWEDIRCSFVVQQIVCLLRHSQTALHRNFADIPSPEQLTSSIALHLQETGSVGERILDRFRSMTGNKPPKSTLFPVSETCDSYEWTYHSHIGNPYKFQLYTIDGTSYDDVEWCTIQQEIDVAIDREYSIDKEYSDSDPSDESSSQSSLESDASGTTDGDLMEEHARTASRGVETPSSNNSHSFDEDHSRRVLNQDAGHDLNEDNMSVLSLEMWHHTRENAVEPATVPEDRELDRTSLRCSPISNSGEGPSTNIGAISLDALASSSKHTSSSGKRVRNDRDSSKRGHKKQKR